MTPDPVRLEVMHHLFAAVCEEAGSVLQRAALSPNIRERRDFSVALFDGDARLVGQAAHIPVHLGSAGDAVRAAMADLDFAPGDVALLNDPYRGGTHLPDITAIRPVFAAGAARPSWFLACRAHHADVGGATPGSMGLAADLHGEGLVLPPVHWRRAGVLQDGVAALLRANVRGADERMGDLAAQEAALAVAARRLAALEADLGADEVARYAGYLMDYAERVAQQEIDRLPPGCYTARDQMEDDGTGAGPFALHLDLHIEQHRLRFDFRRTAAQARGGINANRSIVVAAAVYVLRCLCPGRLPTNEGLFRLFDVETTPGTLVDPIAPAPVAGGNVETSQRLVDVGLRALARALPDRVPAASAGTMSNLTMGGAGFAFYETLPGGAGAGPQLEGASGLQTHMTNTRNTPVEEFERRFPLRVRRLTLRRRSGGAGARRGGDGLVKEIVALAPVRATLMAERHVDGPRGLRGGAAGATGSASIRRGGGRPSKLPSKGTVDLEPGDSFTLQTPGGGGHGRARRKPRG